MTDAPRRTPGRPRKPVDARAVEEGRERDRLGRERDRLRVQARLPRDLVRALDQAATEERRTREAQIEVILAQWVARHLADKKKIAT